MVAPPQINETSQSEFGRNSNFSFASGAFSNNLKGRVKTIKEKQAEYVATSVPKPKQRKQWKQDISHLEKLPGTHILPRAPSKTAAAEAKHQSPEKTRQKEFLLLEEKRDLYVSEVERIKREFRM